MMERKESKGEINKMKKRKTEEENIAKIEKILEEKLEKEEVEEKNVEEEKSNTIKQEKQQNKKRRKEEKMKRQYRIEECERLMQSIGSFEQKAEEQKQKLNKEKKIIKKEEIFSELFKRLNVSNCNHHDEKEIELVMKESGLDRKYALDILSLRDSISRFRKRGNPVDRIINRYSHHLQNRSEISSPLHGENGYHDNKNKKNKKKISSNKFKKINPNNKKRKNNFEEGVDYEQEEKHQEGDENQEEQIIENEEINRNRGGLIPPHLLFNGDDLAFDQRIHRHAPRRRLIDHLHDRNLVNQLLEEIEGENEEANYQFVFNQVLNERRNHLLNERNFELIHSDNDDEEEDQEGQQLNPVPLFLPDFDLNQHAPNPPRRERKRRSDQAPPYPNRRRN